MKRSDIEQKMNRDLDGRLSPQERVEWETTLAADPDLAREQQQLRTMTKALRAVPAANVPMGLADRIVSRALRSTPDSAPTLSLARFLRRSAALAAAALVLAGALFVSRLPDQALAGEPVHQSFEAFLPSPEYQATVDSLYGSSHLQDAAAVAPGTRLRYLSLFRPVPEARDR